MSNSSSNLNSPVTDVGANDGAKVNGRLPAISEVDETANDSHGLTMSPPIANGHTESGSGSRKRKKQQKKK